MAQFPISVQLYTLRDLLAKDFPGIMKKIAKIGYKYVELAGYGNLKTAAEAKKAIDDAGLKVSGAHVGIDQFKNINQALDDANTLGNPNLMMPWIGEEYRTADGYKKLAEELNRIGAEMKKHGKGFGYHNHDFEFKKVDGNKSGFDILWANSDPILVRSELDVYWVKRGGEDPVGYINKLGKRLLLLHLKDMSKTDPTKFAEVGTGSLDIKAIVAAGNALGVQFGVVEQDDCYGKDPLEVIRVGLEHLKNIGAA